MAGIKIKIFSREKNIRKKITREIRNKKSSELKPVEISSPKVKVDAYDKVAKAILFLLVFLLPVFFIPVGNGYPLELAKQVLFEVLIFIALFIFLFKKLKSREFNFVWNPLHIGVLIFLAVLGLSTIFSVWRYGSFWGISLDVGRTFLTIFLFALFYFLFVNVFREEKSIYRAVITFFVSVFLATLFSILQLFGKFLLPWNFTKVPSFNPVGTVNGLALLIAILLPAIVVLEVKSRKVVKVAVWIFSLVFLFYLLMVNYKIAWMALSVGMTALFIFEMVNAKRVRENSLVLPVLFLTLAIFFSIFRLSIPLFPQVPLEISLSQRAEVSIGKDALRERLFLGSGPGTFIYNFTKFKPKSLNQTVLWNTSFPKGASEILDMAITTGLLGILSFFIMIGIFFRFLLKETLYSHHFLKWGIFSSFFALFVTFFIRPANFLIWFLLFLIMSVIVALKNSNLNEKNNA